MSVLLAVVLAASSAGELDAQARVAVRDRFERVGRQAPRWDDALDRAAKALAARALEKSAAETSSLMTVTAAISRAGGWDPSPTTLVLKAHVDDVVGALAARQDVGREPATAVGLGLAADGPQAAVVVLFARRRAVMEPFPRTHKKPVGPQRLCAKLESGLGSPELYVTRPGGGVDRAELTLSRAGVACGPVAFPAAGRHTVEVMARGGGGPVVTALFFVDVGEVPPDADEALSGEVMDASQARAAILVRVNALRLSQGLTPVKPDADLDAVAQAYAARMAADGFFAHVAPDGSDLRGRLDAAKYTYSAAGENLGLASSPLAAHFGIEHSPGHRKNLLEPVHRRLGVGLAERDGLALVVEVLAAPADEAGVDPLSQAYEAIDRARAAKGLGPVTRSPVLEALAQEHAREAARLQTPKAALPGQRSLHERAFELIDAVKAVTVDVFVVVTPGLIADSKNLADPRSSLVGVGLVKATTERYGADRYWVVVAWGSVDGRK